MLSDVHLIVCSDNALITNYISSSTERQVFLATWKDIPNDSEAQFQIKDCHLSSGKKGWLENGECTCLKKKILSRHIQ